MPDRFIVSEQQQIGIESSPGVAAVPTILFQALDIVMNSNLDYDEFKPSGQLPQSIVAPRQEWASGSVAGYPTYTEIAYPIANVLGAAVITTPSGATLGRRWLWEPSPSTPWTPKTWTLRRGVSGDTAEEANYLLLSGLGFKFSRTAKPEISGNLFAQVLNYGATLAATGVTAKSNAPILAPQVDMYLDATAGGLGVTKLLRDFSYEWSIADLFDMIWPLNSANASYAAHSVKVPKIEAKLVLGNDAAGRALVTNMRAGTAVFTRLRANGAASSIESGQAYRFTIDTALMCVAAPSRGDMNGLSTLEWTFRNVYDAGWGKFLSIELITNFASL